jgi:rhodanese-related sulfurtransferase
VQTEQSKPLDEEKMTLPRNITTNPKRSILLVVLIVAAVLVCGCVGGESTPPPDQPPLSPEPPPLPDQPEPSPEGTITKVTPEEALVLIQKNSNNPDFVIIDVRRESDFAAGHIEGAVNIPWATLGGTIDSLDKSKTYLTYCRDGCGAAGGKLQQFNFQKIYDISGGYDRWVGEGFPIVK